MDVVKIPLQETGQMHPFINDYLSNQDTICPYPNKDIIQSIKERDSFPINREILVAVLEKQYQNIKDVSKETEANIQSLKTRNTFTITTGHQLNIFTGPLYFIYKIASTISYSRKLRDLHPEYNFVPVFWMASEDHDFEEISHIYLYGKTIRWETNQKGAVGKFLCECVPILIDEIEALIGDFKEAKKLIAVFRNAYKPEHSLSEATRILVNHLFGKYGLVILNPDDSSLKKFIVPALELDIFTQKIFNDVTESTTSYSGYKMPVNPRQVNVFYLEKNSRKRIEIKEENISEHSFSRGKLKESKLTTKTYSVNGGSKSWNEEQLRSEIKTYPERFSPNVILRPIYQELILPNLCYIGGNNEIAYWFQLRKAFESSATFFPQLLVRDSFAWLGKKTIQTLSQFHIQPQELLKPEAELKDIFFQRNELKHPSQNAIDILLQQLHSVKETAQSLPSESAALMVTQANEHYKEWKKLRNDLDKRLEEQHTKSLEKLLKAKQALFPQGNFQERHDNFISLYLNYGEEFLNLLLQNCDVENGELKMVLDG